MLIFKVCFYVDVQTLTDYPEFRPEDVVASEVVPHEDAATERSSARRLALQVLYEIDSTGHNADLVISGHLETRPVSKKIIYFLRLLVRGVLENRQQLDEIIQTYASEWPLDQVAFIDRNILRISIFELIFEPRVPIGVAIDEAVALANMFGAEGSTGFVNGVLGTIANDVVLLREKMAGSGETS